MKSLPTIAYIGTGSITDYHNTEYIASEAKKRGIHSLESPISNLSHMGVDCGNVSFYVNGDRENFEICKQALNDMGKVSFFVSNKTGEAQAVKLLTNLLCYDVILWSCGTSWISDNKDFYKPDNAILTRMKSYNFEKQANTPTINRIIDMFEK